MSPTKTLSKRENAEYKRLVDLETEIEARYAEGVRSGMGYWKAILEIYERKLWRAKYTTQEEWVGTLSKEHFGPSRTQLFVAFDRYKSLKAHGMTLESVAFALGSGKTAITHDLESWFDKSDGEYKLKPAVEAKLKEEGTTVEKAVMEMAVNLGGGESRARVSDLSGQVRVYCHAAEWYGLRKLALTLVETGTENSTFKVMVNLDADATPAIKAYIERLSKSGL